MHRLSVLVMALTWVLGARAPGAWQDVSAAGASGEKLAFSRHLLEISGDLEPAAAAIGADGNVYVTDARNHAVRIFRRTGSALGGWGTRGHDPGQLLEPSGIAVSNDGHVIVADTGNHRLQQFSPIGTLERAWGDLGTRPGAFREPLGVAVDATRIYVADSGNDRVQVFDRDAQFLFAVGALAHPTAVGVDRDGSFYVADTWRDRIVVFDRDGHRLREFGEYGSFPGLLSEPRGIAVCESLVFVCDCANHRLAAFDRAGQPQFEWGLLGVEPAPGRGRHFDPSAIAIAPSADFAVVTEPFTNRWHVFAGKTNPEEIERRTKRAAYGSGSQSPAYGSRVAMAPVDRTMALLEPATHSVLVYDVTTPEPTLITRCGGHGARHGQLNRPDGIAFDASGRLLYVSDAGNRRVQVFRIDRRSSDVVRYDPTIASFLGGIDLEHVRQSHPELRLAWPVVPGALVVSPKRDLYLLDVANARVLVFDAHLKLERSFGARGSSDGEFETVDDIACDPKGEHIYVVDHRGGTLQAFDAAGKLEMRVATLTDGSAFVPTSITVDQARSLYVVDRTRDRVLVFDQHGALRSAWGSREGQLFKPGGIVALDLDRLVVVDMGNHRGVVFSRDGKLLTTFPPVVPKAGARGAGE